MKTASASPSHTCTRLASVFLHSGTVLRGSASCHWTRARLVGLSSADPVRPGKKRSRLRCWHQFLVAQPRSRSIQLRNTTNSDRTRFSHNRAIRPTRSTYCRRRTYPACRSAAATASRKPRRSSKSKRWSGSRRKRVERDRLTQPPRLTSI